MNNKPTQQRQQLKLRIEAEKQLTHAPTVLSPHSMEKLVQRFNVVTSLSVDPQF